MNEVVFASIITGALGLITGTVGMYFVNHMLEKRREYLSTKRRQLSEFFSPLEILLKINKQGFDRYDAENSTDDDKTYIEKNIWFPNNTKIKTIIMTKSHLLFSLPKEILDLLAHIDVWLAEFELVYVKREKSSPVFAGPKGYGYPSEVDGYIYQKAGELRVLLNVN